MGTLRLKRRPRTPSETARAHHITSCGLRFVVNVRLKLSNMQPNLTGYRFGKQSISLSVFDDILFLLKS